MNLFRFLRGAFGIDRATKVEKQDIAEVGDVVEIVLPVVDRWWKSKVRQAMAQLERTLQGYSEVLGEAAVDTISMPGGGVDEARLEREMEAILGALDERLGCGWGLPQQELVEEASRDLLTSGALAIGVVLALRSPRLLTTASRDLALSIRARPLLRRTELREQVRAYLTSGRIRDALRQDVLTAPAAAATLASDWRRATRTALGSYNWKQWGPALVDAWAYRWHNVGRFEAAPGVRRWSMRNPKDARTTRFCNWVHGRTISARRVRKQLETYYKAINTANIVEAMRVWPLTEPPSGVSSFRERFSRSAFPPFHFRCRTVAVPA